MKTCSVEERVSLVRWQDFSDFSSVGFLSLFPRILKGNDLRDILLAFRRAAASERPIIWALGGHVVKCGLSPLIVSLMDRGMVGGIAMTGATAIHDFEIAFHGETSEDVRSTLPFGDFGMARETADWMNCAINTRAEELGIGAALGEALVCRQASWGHLSLLAAAHSRKIPVTVHVALGADVIHMHPSANGARIGRGSLNDFLLLVSLVSQLEGGGIFLNVGSAVILPEVFLKALSLARSRGNTVDDFVTINLDMIQHYRPNANVVVRPHERGRGKGYSLTGHHEIMIPLLYGLLTNRV